MLFVERDEQHPFIFKSIEARVHEEPFVSGTVEEFVPITKRGDNAVSPRPKPSVVRADMQIDVIGKLSWTSHAPIIADRTRNSPRRAAAKLRNLLRQPLAVEVIEVFK